MKKLALQLRELGHLPGYKYCGVANKDGKPINALDAACERHDLSDEYKSSSAYFADNGADSRLLHEIEDIKGPSAAVVRSFFTAKKWITNPFGNAAKMSKRPRSYYGAVVPYKRQRTAAASSSRGGARYGYGGAYVARRVPWFRGAVQRTGYRRSAGHKKMPRGRGRRRLYYGRGRVVNKRRYRSKRRLTRLQILKALAVPREAVYEYQASLDMAAGRSAHFWAPFDMLDPETITHVNSVEMEGQGGIPIGGGTRWSSGSVCYGKYHGVLRVINTQTLPLDVQLVWLVCKSDEFRDDAFDLSLGAIAIRKLVNGWALRILDTDEVNAFTYTSGSTTLTTRLDRLGLSNSTELHETFKVNPSRRGMLNPGESATFKWKRTFKVSYRDCNEVISVSTDPVVQVVKMGIENLSVVPLLIVRTTYGHATLDVTTQANLGGVIGATLSQKYRLYHLQEQYQKPLLAFRDTKQHTLVDGVGPSIYEDQKEE